MLQISRLEKSYGSKQVLKGIDLTIGEGEIVGLFGENGAGKTTLLKSVLKLIKSKGEILLDGEILSRKNIERLSFATCEHSYFPNLSPKAHREFYESVFAKFRRKRFEALMEFFELPMNRPVKSFSTGQKNQFEVIMALCQGADYILMDEPFTGNDIFNREDFYKVLLGILEPEETVILSTHLIEEVENFISRAVLIRQGEIVGDVTVDELEEQGISLMEYIKSTYHYQADRVGRALSKLTEEE